jgi:hypothetical protein
LSLALQYSSDEYCGYIYSRPASADSVFDYWKKMQVDQGLGVVGEATNFQAFLLFNEPPDLIYGPIVSKWNFGDDNSWYSSFGIETTHTYTGVGNYQVSYFRGNTETGNYLICTDRVRVYQSQSVSGQYPIDQNNPSVNFYPPSGVLGGIYFTTSDHLQNTTISGNPVGCYRQAVDSSGYSYYRDICANINTTYSWLVNLSSGVSGTTVSISPSWGLIPYGTTIKDVVLYYGTLWSRGRTPFPPGEFGEKCYKKKGIRFCCKQVDGRKACWVKRVPPPGAYAPSNNRARMRLDRYLLKLRSLARRGRKLSWWKLKKLIWRLGNLVK